MPKSSPAPAAEPYFTRAALRFLAALARNNRREWFEPRKPEFERELKQPMLALIAELSRGMESFAPAHLRPPQKTLMRIYRDTRFSSDKRPYKHHMAAWWSPDGLEKTSGAGFYLHIAANETIIAAGVFMPEREQLRAIRTYLMEHHEEVRALLADRALRRLMDSFSGEPLARPPKGFPKEHPAMDLILCRQWGLSCAMKPESALRSDFASAVLRRFRLAAPLVHALNAPLLPPAGQRRAGPKSLLFGFR
jgi:uncharacterized protein (TIGR02453 family)